MAVYLSPIQRLLGNPIDTLHFVPLSDSAPAGWGAPFDANPPMGTVGATPNGIAMQASASPVFTRGVTDYAGDIDWTAPWLRGNLTWSWGNGPNGRYGVNVQPDYHGLAKLYFGGAHVATLPGDTVYGAGIAEFSGEKWLVAANHQIISSISARVRFYKRRWTPGTFMASALYDAATNPEGWVEIGNYMMPGRGAQVLAFSEDGTAAASMVRAYLNPGTGYREQYTQVTFAVTELSATYTEGATYTAGPEITLPADTVLSTNNGGINYRDGNLIWNETIERIECPCTPGPVQSVDIASGTGLFTSHYSRTQNHDFSTSGVMAVDYQGNTLVTMDFNIAPIAMFAGQDKTIVGDKVGSAQCVGANNCLTYDWYVDEVTTIDAAASVTRQATATINGRQIDLYKVVGGGTSQYTRTSNRVGDHTGADHTTVTETATIDATLTYQVAFIDDVDLRYGNTLVTYHQETRVKNDAVNTITSEVFRELNGARIGTEHINVENRSLDIPENSTGNFTGLFASAFSFGNDVTFLPVFGFYAYQMADSLPYVGYSYYDITTFGLAVPEIVCDRDGQTLLSIPQGVESPIGTINMSAGEHVIYFDPMGLGLPAAIGIYGTNQRLTKLRLF